MTQDIELSKDLKKNNNDKEILDRFHPANYISLKEFIYENPKGFELKPNNEDFNSFNKTFCRFLLLFLPAIIKRIEKREGKVKNTINTKYLSEMKNMVTNLEVAPVSFFNSDNADFLDIKENGEIEIGKILKTVLYVLNDNMTRKLYNFDFHYSSLYENSTLFTINSNLFKKFTNDIGEEINGKLNILNNSLNSARVLWAERVTNYLKSKKILCQAYDIRRELVQIECSLWDNGYNIHYSCFIINNAGYPRLHNLKIHKNLYTEVMIKGDQEEVDKRFEEIYKANKTKFPYRDQKVLINALIKEFYDRGKVVTKSLIMESWKLFVDKDNTEWRNRGGRPKKSDKKK